MNTATQIHVGISLPGNQLHAAATARLLEEDVAILMILVQSARGKSGWLRRGVRGWHFYSEIEMLLRQSGRSFHMPSSLNDLCRRRGLLTGLEIRDVAGGRVYLYRTNEPGARVCDAVIGQEHVPVDPWDSDPQEDRRMLFMPIRAWAALTALQKARTCCLLKPRWGEHGWLSSAEMGAALGDEVLVDTLDLYWLERRKLVVKRPMPNPGRPIRPAVYWRATLLAERTRVVDDYGVMSGLGSLLQVEIADGVAEQTSPARPLSELLREHRRTLRRKVGLPAEEDE